MRQQGTTCIIEDIAFHIEDLPDAIDEVSGLLDKYHPASMAMSLRGMCISL